MSAGRASQRPAPSDQDLTQAPAGPARPAGAPARPYPPGAAVPHGTAPLDPNAPGAAPHNSTAPRDTAPPGGPAPLDSAEAADDDPPPRGDWRDTLRDASELALVGIVATLVALPLVTLGAALATASAAIHDRCAHGRLPDLRTSLRRFGPALLPGLAASAVAAAGVALLVLDIRALVTHAVPGGPVLLAATAVIATALLGAGGLTLVEVGRRGGVGWLPAARAAVGSLTGRGAPGPLVPLAMGLTLVVGTVLAAILPPTAPVMLGFTLFALHSIAQRTWSQTKE